MGSEALTPVGVSRDGLSIYWGQGYNQEYKTTLNTDVDITQKLDIISPFSIGVHNGVRTSAVCFYRFTGEVHGFVRHPVILLLHVPVTGEEREFSQIDPNEIENLSILKDASATAVFGVRGADKDNLKIRSILPPHCHRIC